MTRGLQTVGVCLAILVLAGAMPAQAQSEPVEAGVSASAEPGAPLAVAPTASVLRIIRFNGSVPGGQAQAALAGPVGVTFALYAEQEGGAPLWLETQNVSLDPQGRYTALLGSASNEGLPLELFTSGEARWLGIQVQGQAEQPRILLVSVPYALRAEEAQRLAGREASEFLLAEQMESEVQQVVETKVVEEMEAQGLVATDDGITRTITDAASTFTDNNTTQVVQVTQQGTGKAVKATSTTGNTIEAESTGTSGTNFTLLGINRSTGGRALFGLASATSGATIAAAGRADSPLGIGFFGQALSTTGPTVAVQGEVRSPNGIAGLFANTAGGTLLLGKSAGQEVFSVDGNGSIEADGSLTLDGSAGIGTNNPTSKLHVSGATGSVNVLIEADTDNFGESDQPSLTLTQDGGVVVGQLGYFDAENKLTLKNSYPDALQFGTNDLIRMVVTGTGDVGIGESAPTEKLHVAGNVKASGVVFGDSTSQTTAGLTAYQRVSSNFTLNANTIVAVALACPGGKKAVGGGFSYDPTGLSGGVQTLIRMNRSFPSSETAWTVTVSNSNASTSVPATIWVTCATAP